MGRIADLPHRGETTLEHAVAGSDRARLDCPVSGAACGAESASNLRAPERCRPALQLPRTVCPTYHRTGSRHQVRHQRKQRGSMPVRRKAAPAPILTVPMGCPAVPPRPATTVPAGRRQHRQSDSMLTPGQSRSPRPRQWTAAGQSRRPQDSEVSSIAPQPPDASADPSTPCVHGPGPARSGSKALRRPRHDESAPVEAKVGQVFSGAARRNRPTWGADRGR